jgi:hypothetical protein
MPWWPDRSLRVQESEMVSQVVPTGKADATREFNLNGHDVSVTAKDCGDTDVGSVEVCVSFADGTRGTFDIGVGEYCLGEGNRLTPGMLNDGDTAALGALALEVDMPTDDVLTRLVVESEIDVAKCIKDSKPL